MQQNATTEEYRHNQLFELLRQNHQAKKTVAQAKGYRIRKVTDEELCMLRAAAVRSLQANH